MPVNFFFSILWTSSTSINLEFHLHSEFHKKQETWINFFWILSSLLSIIKSKWVTFLELSYDGFWLINPSIMIMITDSFGGWVDVSLKETTPYTWTQQTYLLISIDFKPTILTGKLFDLWWLFILQLGQSRIAMHMDLNHANLFHTITTWHFMRFEGCKHIQHFGIFALFFSSYFHFKATSSSNCSYSNIGNDWYLVMPYYLKYDDEFCCSASILTMSSDSFMSICYLVCWWLCSRA